ncbi:IclR family transcriptional regulator C-terminal domain-containing protein [Streptomyces rimosus]|uniref:IclR family transcriptional regulator domain-containing protein n=1 Tax=Streptomyces rimosus TaxID=1927 RepID=UPI002D21DA14|nr:IclR family transcriptional regulator C-terminal domain-containing protein [Streptomyces rimosus]
MKAIYGVRTVCSSMARWRWWPPPTISGVRRWRSGRTFVRRLTPTRSGQCLPAQLVEQARKDHLARCPVQPLTPCSVRTEGDLLYRLDSVCRAQVAYEQEKYAFGTVSSAIPIQVGPAAAVMAISLPAGDAQRLHCVTDRLRRMAEATLATLAFSVSTRKLTPCDPLARDRRWRQ